MIFQEEDDHLHDWYETNESCYGKQVNRLFAGHMTMSIEDLRA